MLTREDLQEIRGVVREEVNASEVRIEQRVTKSVIFEAIPQITDGVMVRITSEVVPNFVDQVVPRVVDQVVPLVVDQVVPLVVDQVVPRVVDQVVSQVGDMIEQNILPQFDELRQEFRFMKAHMVTRFDLEDRLADFRLSLGKKLVRKAA